MDAVDPDHLAAIRSEAARRLRAARRAEGTLKRCPRCDTEKPRSEFNRDSSKADGLVTFCRACRRG